jgi:hypothetical protein
MLIVVVDAGHGRDRRNCDQPSRSKNLRAVLFITLQVAGDALIIGVMARVSAATQTHRPRPFLYRSYSAALNSSNFFECTLTVQHTTRTGRSTIFSAFCSA